MLADPSHVGFIVFDIKPLQQALWMKSITFSHGQDLVYKDCLLQGDKQSKMVGLGKFKISRDADMSFLHHLGNNTP